MALKPFRYSGNKVKLTPLYKLPDKKVKRVVEPYLGSAAFSLNCGLDVPVIGYEINEDLYAMWQWLKVTTEDELWDLYHLVEDLKKKELKPDTKTLGLDAGPLTYIRINVTGLIVGQLSSWGIYPQHKLPVESTIQCLPRIRNFEIKLGEGENFQNSDDDLVFIDPPYVGTFANYKSIKNKSIEAQYQPDDTKRLIQSLNCPIIFTYGTNASEIFPEYEWQLLKTIKVPNMRKGGTVDRFEYVSYINF